jgi:hypothetical protein
VAHEANSIGPRINRDRARQARSLPAIPFWPILGQSTKTHRMSKSKKADGSVVSDDGLRYKAKNTGSPFIPGKGIMLHGATMSCFLCGAHKKFDELESKKLIGKNQKVCKGGCKKK